MLLIILLAATVVGFLYYYCTEKMRYWKKRGVDAGNPKLVFGHYWDMVVGKFNATEINQKIYTQNPNSRYTGMYFFSNPVLMVKDPELIKDITVKDFEAFSDHIELAAPDSDPLWAKNLFSLLGSKWKEARTHLSPSFTSSKMRTLFVLMMECADKLTQHLLQKDQEVVTTELRDLFSRYTNDVIATTVFGIKVDSLTQPDNEFYEKGNDVANFSSFKKVVKFLMYKWFPVIKNVMQIQLISDENGAYFRGIIDKTIKTREEKGIVRPDMLHLLLEARKNKQKQDEQTTVKKLNNMEISNDDITAHALIFFIGGFESVSSFISFTTYELAVNPDVQEKLRNEVRSTLEECGGKLTYEAIINMKYMDMVVSESLRKWPSFTALNRKCTKDYTIGPVIPGEKPVHMKVGMEINIPMYSIHHDPKYFPDPYRFDPERFNDENKRNIQPYTYFPFGLGPRNCIGSRFTILEGKILLFQLLTKFEIVPVERTAIPLKFMKTTLINLKPEDGFWLGFKKCEI